MLVDIDFGRAFAWWGREAGVPAGRLAARFRVDEAYCAHERGEMAESEYFAALRRSLGIAIADQALREGWNAVIGEPLPGIEPLVARLAQRFPLYVFSNTNPAHLAHFAPRHRRLLSHFRRTVTSCEIGSRKPEPRAFLSLSRLLDIAPERLVFFDDLEENVRGARQAGLQAFRVSSAAEIESISGRLAPAGKAG